MIHSINNVSVSGVTSYSKPGWQRQSAARSDPRAEVLCPAAHAKQRGAWKCGW